jgi:uncharacterized small protein (DUF1192 family)
MVLIFLNTNAIKKEKKTFDQTLKEKEESMGSYEVEIGRVRKELAETILDLQKEIEELKIEKISHKDNIDIKNKQDFNIKNYTNIIGNDVQSVEDKISARLENNIIMDVKETQINKIQSNNNETYNKSGKKVNRKKNNSKQNYESKEIKTNLEEGINNSNIDNENNIDNKNSIKIDEISKMLQDNLSIDEISDRIGMAKGEVLLIKELYVK